MYESACAHIHLDAKTTKVLQKSRINFVPNVARSSSLSFTVPLSNPITDHHLRNTLFAIGEFQICTLYLKSLDYYIPEKEVKMIQKLVQTFVRGWLNDYIIDAYLYQVTFNDNDVLALSTALGQV